LLGLGFEPVTAQLIKAVVHIVVDFLRVEGLDGMVEFPGLEDAAELNVFRRDRCGEFDDGLVGDGRVFLGQVADGDASFGGDFARIGGFIPEDDGEKGGLAGPVWADQADPVLAVDLQGGIGKQYAVAVSFADAGQSQHQYYFDSTLMPSRWRVVPSSRLSWASALL